MTKKKWMNPEVSTLGVSLTEKGREGILCDHVQPGDPPQAILPDCPGSDHLVYS